MKAPVYQVEERLKTLVERYRMTVTEAGNTVVPCGAARGQLMRDQHYLQLKWYANKTTKMSHTAAFRKAVKAARILLASMALKSSEKFWTDAQPIPSTAKTVSAVCNDCGRRLRVSRNFMDKRGRPACFSCGGTLAEELDPVGDWITKKEAVARTGKTLRQITRAFYWASTRKRGGRWEVEYDSLLHAFEKEEEAKRLAYETSLGMPHDNPKCPHCCKIFRSWAALRLHVRDQHEDF